MNALSPFENALVGAVSGAEVLLFVQPMVYWKNATQQGLPYTLNPRILYRGLGVSASSQGFITGIQFLSTSVARRLLTAGNDEKRPLTSYESIISALFGGCCGGLVCGPMELLMIQQQRFGGSLFSTTRRLFQSNGVASYARGLLPSVVREGVYCCGYLGIAPQVSKQVATRFEKDDVIGQGKARLAGALTGGIFAGFLSHPFDTIKTCLQGEEFKANGKQLTLQQVLQKSASGTPFTQFLFRGVIWRTTVIITATLLINIFQDVSARVLYSEKFK
eukprot:g214.t1